jgi:hypothetical protein
LPPAIPIRFRSSRKSALRKLQRLRLNSPTDPKGKALRSEGAPKEFRRHSRASLRSKSRPVFGPWAGFPLHPRVGIRRVPESILIRLANTIDTARKMALPSEGAPDCNQETSRYSGIMPYLVSIYKNDFVKDIRKNLASHPLLAVCQTRPSQQTMAFHGFARRTKRCAARGEARVAEGKDRFLNRSRCVFPANSFATSLIANC